METKPHRTFLYSDWIGLETHGGGRVPSLTIQICLRGYATGLLVMQGQPHRTKDRGGAWFGNNFHLALTLSSVFVRI